VVNTRPLTDTPYPLVIRTDFSDDTVWRDIQHVAKAPVGPEAFVAYLEYLSERLYEGTTSGQLLLLRGEYRHSFLVVADSTTMRDAHHPLLIIDLFTDPGRTFRAAPEALQSIENNLSTANLDFADFAEAAAAEPDEIFRDFPV
jgi:hypothetical protein